MPNERIFSDEYQLPPSTHAEEPAKEHETQRIEFQLEERVKQEAQTYGTGKPKREVIRAKIVHD